MNLDSVKYSHSDLCPMVDYGRSNNLFYLCEWGLETHDIPLPEIAAQLQLLPADQEVVFPTSFLLGHKGPFVLEALDQLPAQKRFMVMLGDEELELADLIQGRLNKGWSVDILFDKPISVEMAQRLERYSNPNTRLIFVANRRSDQFDALQSVPANWWNQSFVTFLPPGKRPDLFLTADEVILFQDNWLRALNRGKLFEPRVLSYRPINLSAFSFFTSPTQKNFVEHFSTLGRLKKTRLFLQWTKRFGGTFQLIMANLLFFAVRPMASIGLPFKKLFWFVEYQARKRLITKDP